MNVRFASLWLLACAAPLLAADSAVIKRSVQGDPGLKSIQVLSFAPGGVLLIGDGAGSQIVAVDTGDKAAGKPLTGVRIDDLQQQVAARLGAVADGVQLIDLAVNPASGKAYLAVLKQDDKTPLILTIDHAAEIGLLPLEEISYARVRLSAGDDVKITQVTDVAWADDRIVAAGRSNETFASKIFSIAAPLQHDDVSNTFTAETFHVSHNRWETKAPMSVLIPFKEGDSTYVVGAFSCTPVVKYPLDALQPGAQVKGASVMELGSGNRPIDMFVYEKDGKPFVLSNTYRFHHKKRPFSPSPYWTVKFEQSILAAQEDVNEKALRRLKGNEPATDAVQMVEAFHGVMQMDKLGDAHAVVIKQGEGEKLSLEVLPLP